MQIQLFLPILLAIVLFFVVQYISKKKLFKQNLFIRLRILMGCVYVGYVINEINNASSPRSVVVLLLLGSIIVYSVYRLQQKYFVLKTNE